MKQSSVNDNMNPLQNLDQQDKKIQKIKQTTDKSRESVKRLAGAWSDVGSKVRSVATSVAATVGVGALLGRGFMSGTIEADRLQHSTEMLSRVIGDQLAPYVRGLTDFILQLAREYKSLSSETKQTIAKVIVFTGAIAGIITLLPIIVSGFMTLMSVGGSVFSALFTVVRLFVSPWFLLISVIGLVVASILGLYDPLDGFKVTMKDVMEFVLKQWYRLEAIIKSTVRVIGLSIENLQKMISNTMSGSNPLDGFKFASDDAQMNKIAKEMEDKIKGIPQVAQEGLDKLQEMKDKFKELMSSGERLKNAFEGGLGDPSTGFTIKVDTQFEGLQGTFDRVQKAFASNPMQTAQQAQLGKLEDIAGNTQKMMGGLVAIKDKLPMVR